MAMQTAGVVGPPGGSLQAGTQQVNTRLGNYADTIVSEGAARYYEDTYRGFRFSAANQAAVATTAAFATTYTGLVLYNPNGSNKSLTIDKVGVGQILAQTTTLALGIMVGQSTTAFAGVTALTPRSNLVGSNLTGVGLAASAATLPVAPTLQELLGYIGTGATTVDETMLGNLDLGGDIILPPGAFAAFYTNAASVAASLLFSVSWVEKNYP